MRVRKGDLVQMMAGKDRGKQGRILEARPRQGLVTIENLNVSRRHTKPQPIRNASGVSGAGMSPGGIVDRPMAVPAANVMLVCPTCHKPTRVGYTTKEIKGETVKVRVCKVEGCGQEID